MTKPTEEKYLAAAPLLLFSLLVVAFFLSSALVTSCGRVAGCAEIKGDSVSKVVQLDTVSLMEDLFVSPDTTKASVVAKQTSTKPGPHHKILMNRLERRYVWAFFAGFSGMLSIVNLILAVIVARDLEGVPSGSTRRVLLVLGPTVLLVFILWIFREDLGGVVSPLLKSTIGSPHAALGMPYLPGIIAFLNALSSATAVAVAVAIWFLLQPAKNPGGSDEEGSKRNLADLKRRALYLHLFLYFGTAALVTGVMRMSATIYWMQSFLPDLHQGSLDSFRVTLVSVIGGFYSILLASLFFPAAAIIKERGRAAVASAPVGAKAEAADVDKTFAMPWSKLLPRIVAILGPFLAGPIGEFLKNLMT